MAVLEIIEGRDRCYVSENSVKGREKVDGGPGNGPSEGRNGGELDWRMLGDAGDEAAQRLTWRSRWSCCIGCGALGDRWVEYREWGANSVVAGWCGTASEGPRGRRGREGESGEYWEGFGRQGGWERVARGTGRDGEMGSHRWAEEVKVQTQTCRRAATAQPGQAGRQAGR